MILPHLPSATGPPRAFGQIPGLYGCQENVVGGDSGIVRGDSGTGTDGPTPKISIPGIARGDTGVALDTNIPSVSTQGTARGDPGGEGTSVPEPAVPKEESGTPGCTTTKLIRSEPCPASTPLRARDPVLEELERTTPGLTSMNIYKESQTMTFLNWPDVRGFEAWKNHFYRKSLPSQMNQRKYLHGSSR